MNSQSNNNLEELIGLCAQGDTATYKELYEHLHKPLFGFIVARTGNREDAKDILQDVFVDLWNALSKFSYRSEKQFYGFVFTIAKRKLARYYDSRNDTIDITEQHITDNYGPCDYDLTFILKVVKKLKPKYREVLELRYWSDLTFKDIARFLKSKETTVKVRHHRALKQLDDLLKEYEN